MVSKAQIHPPGAWHVPVLAGLVPLLGAGWMEPFWLVALLVAAAMLLVRYARAHQHLYFSLPVVLALFPVLHFYPDLLLATGAFLLNALGGMVLYALMSQVMQGSLSALLGLALLWVAFPSPLGLLGLFAAALVRATRMPLQVHQARAMWGLAGLLVAGMALTAWIPEPPTQQLMQRLNIEVGTAPPIPAFEGLNPGPAAPAQEEGLLAWLMDASPWKSGGAAGLPPWIYLLLGTLLVTSVVTALLVQATRSKAMRPADLVLMVAALSLVGGLLAYGLLNRAQDPRPGGPGGGTPSLSDALREGDPQGSSGPGMTSSGGTSPQGPEFLPWWLFLLPLGVGVWVLLKNRHGSPGTVSHFKTQAQADSARVTLEGVRKLYHDFLQEMKLQGMQRLAEETPLEFAQRVTSSHPDLQPEVQAITQAYLPVRYGDLPDPDTFEQARQALERLQHHFKEGL